MKQITIMPMNLASQAIVSSILLVSVSSFHDLNWIDVEPNIIGATLDVGDNLTLKASQLLNQTNLVSLESMKKGECTVSDISFPLKWKVPSPLSANTAQSRAWVESWCEIIEPSTGLVLFWAKLDLIEVGYKHATTYTAYSFEPEELKSVTVTVDNPSASFECKYGDQCHSGLCDHSSGRGKCDQCSPGYIFDPTRNKCLQRKSLNGTCSTNKQCEYVEQDLLPTLVEHNITQPICSTAGKCACPVNKAASIFSTPDNLNWFGCFDTISSVNSDVACIANTQCLVANSICGIDLEDEDYQHMKCGCATGFKQADHSHQCLPFRACSLLEYNQAEDSGHGCGEHQFCRLGVCQCNAHFRYDNRGVCRLYGPQADTIWWEKNSYYFGAFIFVVMVGVGIVVCLTIRRSRFRARKIPAPQSMMATTL